MFRFRAKAALLTYSQVDHGTASSFLCPPNGHYNFIASSIGTPDYYRLGRERHEDGGTHFHVAVGWDSIKQKRNPRCFDYAGAHPNIEPVRRTPRKAWDYAGKDGDIIYESGNGPSESRAVSGGRDSIWSDALAAETKEDFLSHLRQHAPRDFVLYNEQLRNFADRHWKTPAPPYQSPDFETIGFDRVEGWFRQFCDLSGGRRRSLILWGPTRTGKTVWARSLGR